jgi:hypothetical protein
VWHEALVPHNGREIEYLFDVEVNALINAIAARTTDLTVVLDCCHSAGATRGRLNGNQAKGAVRLLNSDHKIPSAPPNLALLGLDISALQNRAVTLHMLQLRDPDYVVVVACQSDETAGEGPYPSDAPSHGVFTNSLLGALSGKDASQRSQLRWADIWGDLLVRAAECNGQLDQPPQHPWIIGRAERRIFGGAWERMDAGYRVTKRSDGNFDINSGTYMGVTKDAEIAVYGSTPPFYPVIGSPEDHPFGRLKVIEAGPSCAIGISLGAPFALLDGARGRLVKPGESERLRVILKPEDATLNALLQKSPLLEIVSAGTLEAEVQVTSQSGGKWIIGNEIEPLLATVPEAEHQALRAGLESYYRYNLVLRMARNSSDPDIRNSLSIRLLDCNDQTALSAMSPQTLADPNLPEAPRDQDRIYALKSGFKFCVKVTNSSRYPLSVALLNCSAGGLVEYLGDALLREGAAQVMWLDNKLGTPFEAEPDNLTALDHGISLPDYTTDRLIVLGTTRPGVDLNYLSVDQEVQKVVNDNLSRIGGGLKSVGGKAMSAGAAELWTATVIQMRIPRQ